MWLWLATICPMALSTNLQSDNDSPHYWSEEDKGGNKWQGNRWENPWIKIMGLKFVTGSHKSSSSAHTNHITVQNFGLAKINRAWPFYVNNTWAHVFGSATHIQQVAISRLELTCDNNGMGLRQTKSSYYSGLECLVGWLKNVKWARSGQSHTWIKT